MAYYDRIAKQWHQVTGSRGGALKQLVLNDLVLNNISAIAGCALLELGAGNGYFMPQLLRHFSGQVPSRIIITDQSPKLLELAQRFFKVTDAEYLVLDVRNRFPFEDAAFDLILANMVFNEITNAGLRRALRECRRLLRRDGRLLATVTHPRFVASLARRRLLKEGPKGMLTMPGSVGLRLPVVLRSLEGYHSVFQSCGFHWCSEEAYASAKVLKAKPGLRAAGKIPIAMLFHCEKISS